MSYRTIQICLEHEDSVEQLTAAALKLAADGNSHISGVHTVPGVDVHVSVSPYIPISVLNNMAQRYNEHAKQIRANFEKVASPGDATWEWIQKEGRYVSDYKPYISGALASDIVVTTQPTAYMEGTDLQRTLLLEAGIPVLVVPTDGVGPDFAEHICVAWNATAEAARAVRDAMPLLKKAAMVDVIYIDKGYKAGDNSELHGVGIASYLSRHGVTSTIHELDGKHQNIGFNLLEHAKNQRSDLLVMGGFGHSRLYDAVIGAATREIIKSMHLPVLFSH